MYGDENSDHGPPGTFESYRAEGDLLYKNGEYRKAIESYTTALEIREGDKDCLVARSKCHLQLGDSEKALNDANTSLAEDAHFHKGLYQKADALYSRGEFELALVFYHRGHKLRPELQEFRLGIQKAQEAIDNSVGSPDKVTLTKDGDLSFFNKQTETKTKGRGKPGAAYGRPATKQQSKRAPPPSASKDKTVKQLLGELYGDRIYLEKLLKETDPHSNTGRNIYDLVCDGLHYLDTRTDFWRQQKPMYARRRERMSNKNSGSQKPQSNINEYIVRTLTEIDDAQAEGRYIDSLKKAKKCLATLDSYKESDIENKREIEATLHSSIGNACLETGDLEKACNEHQMDLDISTQLDNEDGKSRAMDNLGRVYARQGNFKQAIDVWSSKLPMTKSDLENTWLYHEIGRCHLELGDFTEAHDFGEKALEAAKSADDDMWQLNSAVLVAQSEVKLERLQEALGSFEQALDMARVQEDKAAEAAIKKAMEDVNRKIVAGIKSGDKESEPEEEKAEPESEPEPRKRTPTPEPPPKDPTPEPPKSPTPEPPKSPTPEPPKSPTPEPPKEEEKSEPKDVESENKDVKDTE